MLKQIERFQREAKRLGRDITSVEELKLYVKAQEKRAEEDRPFPPYVVVLYFDHTKHANNVVEDIRNFIQSELSGFAGFVGGHKIVKTDSIFEAVIYSDPSLEEENKQVLKKYDATNYDFYKL